VDYKPTVTVTNIKLFYPICFNPGVKFVTTQNVVLTNVRY